MYPQHLFPLDNKKIKYLKHFKFSCEDSTEILYTRADVKMGLALMNMSSGFSTRFRSNQSAQLQRLATILKFCIQQAQLNLEKANNNNVGQTVPIDRLVSAFVFCMQHKKGFSFN